MPILLFIIITSEEALVAYDKTISIGKLDAGASVLMIDHMEKDGKIEKSGDYNVYRTGELAATRKGERDM